MALKVLDLHLMLKKRYKV